MNKMVVVLGLIVAMMSTSAFGVGFLGTPTAELDKGQWNVGANFTYISTDLAKTKWSEVQQEFDAAGDLVDSDTDSGKLSISDNNVQRYYGTIGYGITDVWEAYVQLGIADVKVRVKGEGGDEWHGLNLDNDFAWGWGTRYTFYEQDNIRWGASLQMNWLDTSWDDKWTEDEEIGEAVTEVACKENIDYSSYDLLIAVGPTVDMGGWSLYGGPFYYMVSGDFTRTETCTWDVGSSREKNDGDLEEDSNFGGFVGAQIGLKENCNLTTEISFTSDGMAIGAGVAWAF